MPKIQLEVGAFVFELQAQIALQIEDPYIPFLVENKTPDILIRCHAGFPKDFIQPEIHYQAKTPDGTLWELHQNDQHTCILVYNPEALTELQQIAYWSEKERTWDIYAALSSQEAINPLAYPLGPLLWYYLSTIEEVLLIHGSAVVYNGKTRVFSGFSGVGKSTMAKIWETHLQAKVINDDRLLLRKHTDGWKVYNTPMFYVAEPKDGPLHTVFFPYHAPANQIEPIHGVKALSKLMAHTIHHGHNKVHLVHLMEVATSVVETHACHLLGVVPTPEVTEFILANESKR